MADHHPAPVKTDIAEHQHTFEGFVRFWVYLAGSAIAVLLFLALFNS